MEMPTPTGKMTLDELNRVVRRLANSSWCRYWVHFNHPQNEPYLMAIQCRDAQGKPQTVRDIEKLGFALWEKQGIYLINRINEDGTPFKSSL